MRKWLVWIVCLVALLSPRAARAAPWGNGEPTTGLWFSLTAFFTSSTVSNEGFVVTAGLPLDALAARGRLPRALADPPVTLPAAPTDGAPALQLTSALARDAVSAAWRAARVADDGRFTGLAARARASALLPEVRLRVMRATRDASAADATATTYSPYLADRTVLEGRVLFRLDRLVFADEEVAIERLRADAAIERERIARRVLEELTRWQRARVDLALSPADSAERVDATLRGIEAETALDVLTAGWFGAFLAGRARGPS